MSDPVLTPSSVSDFKLAAGSLGSPVTLPSGLKATIKAAGMDAFLKAGVIPNSLMQIIQAQLEKAQKGEEVDDSAFDLAALMNDPTKIGDIIDLVETVSTICFVEPRVYAIAQREQILARDDMDEAEKQAKIATMVFVDEVNMDDKFYVFSVASGGTKDLERFRQGFDASVDRVQPRAKVAKSTKSTRRTTQRKS